MSSTSMDHLDELRVARRRSARLGILPPQNLASVFAWLRPNDLVWNYWVNNYLLGQQPPAVDIMAWNADGTNLPARLHAQFTEIFAANGLCHPGAVTTLGSPVDLGRIVIDGYFTGALKDHLVPWKSAYQATQLFGGKNTFVLGNAGHVAAQITPPTAAKARYLVGPHPGPDPDAWLAQAEERNGSWWQHWADWEVTRGGEMRSAPKSPGGTDYPPIQPAPGSYVHS